MILLESNGVVEGAIYIYSAPKFARDCFQGEVPMEGAHNICEHKGNIMGQGFRNMADRVEST